MVRATWTIEDCDPHEAASLAGALGLSQTTASVLVRRGYGDAEAAASFLAGDLPGHDPFALGDMQEACDRISDRCNAARRSTGMWRTARAPKPVDNP